MVEPFLAVANFLLPQSTAASSRPLLALNTLMPRLSLSLASFQSDMSRAHSSNGKRKKGKAARGDDHHHALFEHSDWLHISQRESSLLIYGQFHADISSCVIDSDRSVHRTSGLWSSRYRTHPTSPNTIIVPRPQSTRRPASGKAKMYGISAAKYRRCGTGTQARPTTYHLPP